MFTRKHAFFFSFQLQLHTHCSLNILAMPHPRTSNDVDHVRKEKPAQKKARGPPPKPWPMPKFKPLKIDRKLGRGSLPSNIPADDPLAIFELFFDDEVLEKLADSTNQHAQLCPGPEDRPYARAWEPTTAKELRAYIAAYIWMGIHQEPEVALYWNLKDKDGPYHKMITQHISRNRWQQIDRFFHVAPPPPEDKKDKETVFDKVDWLSEHLRAKMKLYWEPGTDLSVDETIQQFMGRSEHLVNIPTKPTPEGFKIWALANQGYILDWMWHTKGKNKYDGPVDLDRIWVDEEGFSKTQAVVLDLVKQQGIKDDFSHIVWMDNLFTSARLLSALKEEGFGAAGTVRTTKTTREEEEEKHGTEQQRKNLAIDENKGLDEKLSDLKNVYNKQLQWGELYGSLSEDKNVLEFAWKDQNVVLFMSTVHDGKKKVKRQRRRPGKTSTNAATSRAVFGSEAVKVLFIPEFIDAYNHFMGGVDQADQLRSYYLTQRTHRKTWKPLWHFLLDTAIINAYKIGYRNPERPFGSSYNHSTHRKFRQKLCVQLFAKSERLKTSGMHLQTPKKTLQELVYRAHTVDHKELMRLEGKPKNCAVCVAKKRPITESSFRAKRKPLQELSPNTLKLYTNREKRRPRQYAKGVFGCGLCGIHICRRGNCWQEHIEAINDVG